MNNENPDHTTDNAVNSFRRLLEVIKTLRGPDGCPWDRKQTIKSLIPSIFEETYECIDAIEADDKENTAEEIGDLYLLVVMLSYIIEQNDLHTVSEIIDNISDKLIRRHPHVFSDTKVDSVDEVYSIWEDIKENVEGRKKKDSILDSIPLSLPPLERAFKIQKKVSSVGFDWPDSQGVLKKIHEELDELNEALTSGTVNNQVEELGDLLFSVVNYSRYLHIDPSVSLHLTNQKFTDRFKYIEKYYKDNNLKIENASIEELDNLWDKAKELEKDQ